jgi:hypothetical protein
MARAQVTGYCTPCPRRQRLVLPNTPPESTTIRFARDAQRSPRGIPALDAPVSHWMNMSNTAFERPPSSVNV